MPDNKKEWKPIKKKKKDGKRDRTSRPKFRSLDQEITDHDTERISTKIKNDCGDLFRSSLEDKFDNSSEGRKARNEAFRFMCLGAQGLCTEHAPLFANLLLSNDFLPCNEDNAYEVRGVQANYLQAYDQERQYAATMGVGAGGCVVIGVE